MLTAALALSALLATGAPEMRVPAAGLDVGRPADALELAERIRTESRAWCAENRALLTPDHVGDPRVCEREMRRRAVNQIEWRERLRFARAGGLRALNRP